VIEACEGEEAAISAGSRSPVHGIWLEICSLNAGNGKVSRPEQTMYEDRVLCKAVTPNREQSAADQQCYGQCSEPRVCVKHEYTNETEHSAQRGNDNQRSTPGCIEVFHTVRAQSSLTPKLSRAGAVAWRLPVGGKVAGWFPAASMTLRKCRLQRIVRRVG